MPKKNTHARDEGAKDDKGEIFRKPGPVLTAVEGMATDFKTSPFFKEYGPRKEVGNIGVKFERPEGGAEQQIVAKFKRGGK